MKVEQGNLRETIARKKQIRVKAENIRIFGKKEIHFTTY